MDTRPMDREASAGPGSPGRRPRTRSSPSKHRGQSLVEFAITAPVVLFMVLFGVDFGRVFTGWLTLSNAVREAANYAAINPSAWSGVGSPSAQAEFRRLLNAEAAEINCSLPNPIPNPSFPSGTDVGSPAVVAVTCQFSLITPLIGTLLGSPLDVSASASFPIRSGSIAGVPTSGTTLPTPGPTAVVTPSPVPSASPIVDPTPTPVPSCTVPDLVQGSLKTDAATAVWAGAGFTSTNLIFSPLVPPHYDMKDQSRTAGSVVPCTSAMTVYDRKQ
jgi:Flp pilus assembly protein TadG